MAEKPSKEEAKAAKKAEKERKKEEKRLKKQGKKGTNEEIGDEGEESSGKLAVFFVTLVIIAIWMAILILLVKWDVGGFGSTVLTPLLKDVPYVNKILPESEQNPEDVKSTENSEYPYDSLEEAVNRIKELEVQLQNEKDSSAQKDATISELQGQSQQLEQYKAEEAAFEALRQKFDEEVVFSDKAPDINEYKTFYESIEPANAEALYRQVIGQQQNSTEVEEYANTYSSMKPAQAAAIFDTMTSQFSLVADILGAMDTESRAKILGAMNTDNAARLTVMMEPQQ